LASHAADDPFWGGQDRTDDYSVDTKDNSAQDLVGFHAHANEDCEEDKDILHSKKFQVQLRNEKYLV